MDRTNDMVIRLSPDRAEIFVEQVIDGVVSRKSITPDTLEKCILTSRVDDERHPTGLLPLGCIAATMTPKYTYYFIRYPELHADFTYHDTEYLNFPIPRLVFAFKYLRLEKKVAESLVCVVRDEQLTPDTQLYRYPFSNVNVNGSICLGNNALPLYKDPVRLHTLAAYILRMPNNDDHYSRNHNRLHAEYRDLLEQMKGKEPSLYYTDVLVPADKTLKDFMNRR